MTIKLVWGNFNNSHTAKVHYNTDLKEYKATIQRKADQQIAAEYFTDDKQDAINTIQIELDQINCV